MKVYDKFKNFINKEELIFEKDRILLGVSGGPDSLTMLNLFLKLSSEKNIEIAVFHLNHLFREEAKEEAQFVKKICSNYNIDFYLEEFDVSDFAEKNSLSSEQAARKIRLDFLFSYIEDLDFDKISLAHNKDDLVETVFLNMFRGCSLSGLSGIEPKSYIGKYKIIHPLLSISRDEIEGYCKKENLNPRYDKSNEETIYTRNKIRHNIIPYIEKEINPSLKDVIKRMAGIVKEEDDYLEELAKQNFSNIVIEEKNDEIILDFNKFDSLDEVIKRRIIFNTIYKLKEVKADIYLKHYREIKKLFTSNSTNKMIDLPDKIKVKRLYEKLIIKRGKFEEKTQYYSKKFGLGSTVELPHNYKLKSEKVKIYEGWEKDATKNKNCLIDFDEINFPLKIRNRRPGDRFVPLGLNGSKKIKDYFIDKKIKKSKRDKIPLVVDKNGLIIWIVGYHINEKVKITKKTNNILKLSLIKKGG
ncbi:MAG: tRNA lysidine(34) synthetase TilS [Bacillota bacterium]